MVIRSLYTHVMPNIGTNKRSNTQQMFNYAQYYAMFQTTISKHLAFIKPPENMALEDASMNAIEIRDAFKKYSKNVVLKGLNMNVKKGTIYGLLGPSGGGKTTVLNCIIGITALNSGTIFVRCKDRRQIGFMPQEAALMEKFKISEQLNYFGKIYEIQHDVLEKRVKDLLLLVNLPPEKFFNRYIHSLSGGQQRRVSLLIAMIHDPDILILDEPTVGLDPTTRVSLWQFFLRETEQNKKTILITTHYTEEARLSHTIGMMRSGVILAESSTEKLLQDFNCCTLEEIFLHLSQTQKDNPSQNKTFPKTKPRTLFSRKNSYCNFNRLAAQTKKNFCWMKRNPGMLAYILLLPGILALLFCSLKTNNIKGLRIATVSEERCTSFTPNSQPRCDKDFKFSCYLTQILKNKGHIITQYPNLQLGTDAVREGRSMALLYFNRNYTSALIDYVSSTTVVPPPEKTLENCQIQVTTDMTEKLKAGEIKDSLMETFNEMQTELLKSCGYKSTSFTSFVGKPVDIHGVGEIDFVHNALPGFIIPLVFYMATTYSSTAASSERYTGVFRRCFVSGVTKFEMNFALILVQLLVLAVQNSMIVVILYTSSTNSMQGNAWLAIAFVLLVELEGILYGVFLASVIKTESHLINTTIGTIMAVFLISGMIWPMEGMVPWLRQVVVYCPLTSAVDAFRSISIRGWGLDNPKVMSAFQYNITAVIILTTANIMSAKINRNC